VVGLGGNGVWRGGCFLFFGWGGGVVFVGLVSLTSSPYSSELLVLCRGVGLSPGFCYECVCVGFVHLVFYGRENNCVKCRNG